MCDEIGISLQAITNWKKQNSLPIADTAIKIANYFKVDPNWLVFGSIELPDDINSWPSAVFKRVYNLLMEETGVPDSDYHYVSSEQMEQLWKPVEKIISYQELCNWENDRIMPTYKQILELAKHFSKSFAYIADGTTEVPESLEPCKVPLNEYNDFQRFKEYKPFMYKYHCISKDGMDIVNKLVDYIFDREIKNKTETSEIDEKNKHNS